VSEKKKGPLDGIPELEPKQIEEFWKRFHEEKKERERKANLPPELPTGVCVVCKGEVKAEHRRESSWGLRGMRIGGPPPVLSWKMLGYHCTKCGLKYEFPPPEGIL
jgi:hypothetical protein